MKKKVVSLLMVSAMLISVMSGCGSSAASQENGDMETSTEAGRESDSSDDSGTVSLTVWGAEEDQALLNEIVDSFKKEYGSQAQFDITVAAQSESDCKDALLGDLEGGADVFTFVDDQLMSLVAAGALEPVDNADEIKKADLEEAVSACTVNDTLYAYPLTADNGYFMYYDKSVFSDADVASLDQMLSVAAAANKKVTMDWSSGWYLYSFFGNTGLAFGLNDDGISNYCNWNANDTAIKGVDVAGAMLAIAANPGFLNTTDDGFIAGVQDGSVAAGISGVWSAQNIEAAWGANYGAVKLPTYTCAGQQVQMASFSGYKMVGVNAYSKHTDWALKLADWIANEQNQELRFAERQQGPANINVANSEAVKNSPAIQAVLAQSQYASLRRIGGNYWDPVQEFGADMANGNPSGKDLQLTLDDMVDEITASNAK